MRRFYINPASDIEFDAAVHRLSAGAGSSEILQGRLRQRWPQALVRTTELQGLGHQHWYVYRDGQWTTDPATPASKGVR